MRSVISGAKRAKIARVVPASQLASRSEAAHSSAIVAASSRSAGSCGTRPTFSSSSGPRNSRGSLPWIKTWPEVGVVLPTSVPSSVDLPAPLRPITATTSPACTSRSTLRKAVIDPYRTPSRLTLAIGVDPGVGPATDDTGRSGGRCPIRSWRKVVACRLASRTVIGGGFHPATRPRCTTGGAIAAVDMTSGGAPTAAGTPGPLRAMIRSAYCTTRSRRCSAMTTVIPRSCTKRCKAASTSSAAPGSSAEVGSSRTSTRGCAVNTAPIAARCRCPPLRERKARLRRSANPSRSKVSSTRRRMMLGSIPRHSIVYASSSSTVSVTKPANGSWGTTPTRSARSRGR